MTAPSLDQRPWWCPACHGACWQTSTECVHCGRVRDGSEPVGNTPPPNWDVSRDLCDWPSDDWSPFEAYVVWGFCLALVALGSVGLVAVIFLTARTILPW